MRKNLGIEVTCDSCGRLVESPIRRTRNQVMYTIKRAHVGVYEYEGGLKSTALDFCSECDKLLNSLMESFLTHLAKLED